MKRILLLLFLGVTIHSLFAQQGQEESHGLIKWMTLAQAEAANKKQAKPVMIDVYTDWCGWCKKMMATTFSNPVVADYINNYFYPVRFNAETKDSVTFLGKKYGNKGASATAGAGVAQRTANDLAINLLGGKLSYPTIIFFNNNYQFKLIVPGYIEVKDIEPVLVYTLEWVFNTTTVDDFRNNYFRAITPDSLRQDTTRVKWYSFPEAADRAKTAPKKILVFVNTAWCNSGRIMANGTFRDSAVVKYLTDHFYPAYFDAESKDTIIYKGEKLYNDGAYGNFHKFAISLGNGQLTIPSMALLDSDLNAITTIPQYYTPKDILIILHYFAEDTYKTVKWEDYVKKFK